MSDLSRIRRFEPGEWVAPFTLGAVASSLMSVFVSSLALGFALLFWFWDCVRKRRLVLRFPSFTPPLVAFVALVVVAVCVSPEPFESAWYLKKFVKLFVVFLIYNYLGRRFIWKGLFLIFFVAGASAVLGVFEFFWLKEVSLLNRIDGFMSHWMTFSGQMMIGSVALLTFLVFIWNNRTTASKGMKTLFSIMLPVMLLVLALTYTRSAWLGFLGAILVLILFTHFRLLAAFVVIAVAALLFAPASFQERLSSSFDLSDTTTRGRLEIAKTGGRMILSSPLTGVGPRLVHKTALEFRSEHEIPGFAYQHLHNNVIQIAAEAGMPAALAWCAIWIWILRDLIRFRKEGDAFLSFLSLNAVCVIVAFQLMGLFEYNFGDSEVAILLLFFVTAPFAAWRNSKEPERK